MYHINRTQYYIMNRAGDVLVFSYLILFSLLRYNAIEVNMFHNTLGGYISNFVFPSFVVIPYNMSIQLI